MSKLTEFERAMVLFQLSQNEQLHAIASMLSHDSRVACERMQIALADKISKECPLVVALMHEVLA